ncbi:hypothetical protein M422DRAFT_275626 [Sphaerobolus stellatus SS14]|uniref:Uncharacterized protein n=1 Tax=Sphaerobolus stellatus (strain SS14) TaxID=990650 RepID=A0A0C9UET7_SPHS4|nr:hypothetical protein M422DRAFT_275626 [Sphaerobolus stellatus SS14]
MKTLQQGISVTCTETKAADIGCCGTTKYHPLNHKHYQDCLPDLQNLLQSSTYTLTTHYPPYPDPTATLPKHFTATIPTHIPFTLIISPTAVTFQLSAPATSATTLSQPSPPGTPPPVTSMDWLKVIKAHFADTHMSTNEVRYIDEFYDLQITDKDLSKKLAKGNNSEPEWAIAQFIEKLRYLGSKVKDTSETSKGGHAF